MKNTSLAHPAEISETMQTIYERRSIRKYTDQEVSRDLIEQVLDAGRMAPSALNRQPWTFHVITDRRTIKLFSDEISKIVMKDLFKGGIRGMQKVTEHLHFSIPRDSEDPIFYGAPVVIFISTPKDNEWAALDSGMCAQNMLLAARSLGIDSCPVGLAKYVEHTRDYVKLGIPRSEKVQLALILGYGNEQPEPPDRIKDNAIFLE